MKFWSLLGLLVIASCSSHTSRNNFYSSAEHYYSLGEWEDSLTLADSAIKADPFHEDAYLLKAKCLSRTGKYSEAHQLIHERLSLTPHSSKINLALANWHREFGAKEAAISVAKNMIRRDNGNIAAHRILAELSLELGQWEDTVDSLEMVVRADKFDQDSQLTLGELYLKLEKTKKAIKIFEELFEGKSKKFEAAKYLGWIYADSGNLIKANSFIQFLSLDKRSDPFVDKIITRNLLNSADVDKIAVLTSYLEKYNDDWGQHQLYLALKDNGHHEKALDLLARVWNSTAEKKWAAINYANHLYKMGDTELAQNIMDKASKTSDLEDQKLIASTIQSWETPQINAIRALASAPKIHIVKSGETLGDISLHYFKSYRAWHKVFRANQDRISDPTELLEGMELIIPEDQP